MNSSLRLVPLTTLLIALAATAPAIAADHVQKAASEKPAPARHPLRGVIVDVQPKQSALLVKHEDIPGFMPSMTMLFKVDAATLKTAKKDQTITATLVERDGDYWLEDVKPVPAKK